MNSQLNSHEAKDEPPKYPSAPDLGCNSVNDIPYRKDMCDFWEDSWAWLAERGVHLYETSYEPVNGVYASRWLTPSTPVHSGKSLPYALSARKEFMPSKPVLYMSEIGFAQDSEHRDLVIKLVDKDSDQYRILDHLLHDDTCSRPETFPCVLAPLAILDTPRQYSFVAMPMWGNLWGYLLDMDVVREVLRFMQCLLEGLTYLHRHRIAHRDITEANVLVNYYRFDQNDGAHRQDLRRHRKGDNVWYAIMDFDQSIILPIETCVKTCLRPTIESKYGNAVYKPSDIGLWGPTYNPFALDVAMLGNMFRAHFIEVIPRVPALAVLFDKMTTRIVPRRFTAEEALIFFQNCTDDLSHDILLAPVELKMTNFD